MDKGRKLSPKLLEELTGGSLRKLLEYIKNDVSLRFEVRREGEAMVYYRKGKALQISSDAQKFKIDKKYGKIPNGIIPDMGLVRTNPQLYFKQAKVSIDKWVEINHRNEFDTQQKIAFANQDKNDTFLILDMEYMFSQKGIRKEGWVKPKTRFDLLGIERKTSEVTFFELKKGLDSADDKSGIEDHYKNFERHLSSIHKDTFIINLINDIKNIIDDKIKLGIIANYKLPSDFKIINLKFAFIFEPIKLDDKRIFDLKVSELAIPCDVFYVSKDSYKIK